MRAVGERKEKSRKKKRRKTQKEKEKINKLNIYQHSPHTYTNVGGKKAGSP